MGDVSVASKVKKDGKGSENTSLGSSSISADSSEADKVDDLPPPTLQTQRSIIIKNQKGLNRQKTLTSGQSNISYVSN